MSLKPSVTPTAKRNMAAIAQLEQQLLSRRSEAERVGGAVARFFGSFRFIVIELSFVAAWVALNTGMIAGKSPFDPYPFPLLGLIVGVEFIFLATFVLMNQKHQIRRAEQWSHLHLQISKHTERKVAKSMRMLLLICEELALDRPTGNPKMSELAENTAISALADEEIVEYAKA